MTTLEQAARQALETLERASDAGYSVECDETITALREALEQVAPRKTERWNPMYSSNAQTALQMAAVIAHRDTEAAPPAEQQATKETSGGFHVWRDISTAPKDGSRFVATGHNYGLYSEVRHTCVAQWFRGCWMEASDWNETSELKYLTHWMPLPSPPDDVAAPAEQQAAPKAEPGEPVKQTVREQIAAEVATQPAAQVEFLARYLCERDQINPDQMLDDNPVRLAWHREDLNAARLLAKLAELAPRQEAQEPVAHDEDLLEQMYWDFDSQRKKTGEERLAFKGKMRSYASEFRRRSVGQMVFAQSVSDDMMNLADRLGSEFDDVDPRAWKHLLVYAPKAAPGEREQAAQRLRELGGISPDDVTDPLHPRYIEGYKAGHAAGRKRAAPQQEAQEPAAFIHWPIDGPPRLVWYSQKALNDAILKTHEDGYKPDVKLYSAPQPAPAPLSDDVVRDAARYRWLRDVPMAEWPDELATAFQLQQNAIWDAAIDAAIAAQGGKA